MNSRRYLTVVMVAIVAASGLSLTARTDGAVSAQENQSEKPQLQKAPARPGTQDERQQDKPLKLNADLVMLDVTVVDQDNKPVLDLKQEQFQVVEDRTPQRIDIFGRDQVPISVVFTIDTSGSMKPKLDTVIKASTNLVKEGRRGDEMAAIEFKDVPELLSEFTEDSNEITDTLQNLTGHGRTAMLDALYLAADYAHKEGKNRRKAVIMVTDGLDKNSYYKFDEVVDQLRETDVQIYLIGFTNDLSDQGAWVFKKSEKEKAEQLLTKLASETGGRAFFPKELSEVHTIAQQISTDLRTQYSLGYYSTNSKRDGTFRTVRVNVNGGNRRLSARTRAGYTAPRDDSSSPPPRSNPN